MNKFIFYFLAMINMTLLHGQTMEDLINNIRMKYAPDKRTAIFNVKHESVDGINILKGETNLSEAKQELLNLLSDGKIIYNDQIEILPPKELGEKIYGVVNVSVANLRSEPKHPAELATQALLGTIVNVYKKNSGWYLVQTPDKYLGWVDDDAIVLMDENELNQYLSKGKIIIKAPFEVVYADDKRTSIVSDVVVGNILEFTNEMRDEFAVQLPDGRTGYLSGSSAMRFDDWNSQLKISAENIIATAKSFMGIPYLWGGTSCKGFDCSGFTKTVFFMNGIILPRDASQQVFSGADVDDHVNFDSFKKGDLIFFGERASENKKERITHVGIYIGDSEFIHAAGMVKINSLDKNRTNFSEFRFRTFVRAKRILNAEKINYEFVKDSNKYFPKANQ